MILFHVKATETFLRQKARIMGFFSMVCVMLQSKKISNDQELIQKQKRKELNT